MLAGRLGGGENRTRPVSGTAKGATLATQPRPWRSELDTKGWLAYGFAQRLKLKSEIPVTAGYAHVDGHPWRRRLVRFLPDLPPKCQVPAGDNLNNFHRPLLEIELFEMGGSTRSGIVRKVFEQGSWLMA